MTTKYLVIYIVVANQNVGKLKTGGSMKEQEYKWLIGLQESFEDGNDEKLNDWEKNFLTEFFERLDKFADKTFVSAKQWTVFTKIGDKIL
jgi:hypothetical protein